MGVNKREEKEGDKNTRQSLCVCLNDYCVSVSERVCVCE